MDINRRKEFIINTMYIVIISILTIAGFKLIVPATIPFILGLLVALILRKYISLVNNKFKIPYKVSAIIITTLFYAVLITILFMLGVWAAYWAEVLIKEIPNIYSIYIEQSVVNILSVIEDIFLAISNNSMLIDTVGNISSDIMDAVKGKIPDISISALGELTGIAKKVPSLFIKSILTVISTFFIAIDYNRISKIFSKILSKFNKVELIVSKTKEYLTGTLFVVIKSYILIMTITFIELSIGLTLIGIDNSILIALLIAIFDIMPVLGTGGIMIPWAIVSAITGDFKQAILLGILYVTITVIRNIIEPKIVGKELGLHPLITLISMFIGLSLFGGIGLFGIPIGMSLIVYLHNTGTINIPILGDIMTVK